ncbi:hypothetical protein SAMN05421638_1817 [Kaistella treverensis]|uniref:Uncharacterized protein n=1 Tax=Kaistella treverensis TaxID=631455 RepID=A0A1I3MVE4_9FLAO|nr:hypothetical protein [Kaistella treverensis]SFJ00948.1 hypothetical protein SAMN05421638_1817 [Kaistella treverensis]
MKKLLLLAVFFILIQFKAQYFSGEIIIRDKSVYYLNQIYVTNLTDRKTVYTDHFGSFKIPAKPGDVIRFTSIVTDRKDVKVTEEQLQTSLNVVELKIAYYDIQEVVISKFKPTGNLRKDVSSLKNGEKALALQQMIGLPSPKGDGTSPQLPVASLQGGGLSFSVESMYDILSGERKKKERAEQYEKMNSTVINIKNYFGVPYFTNLKIPENLIENFLQFVYSSDDIYSFVAAKNYEGITLYIEKYLPIYQRRLRNSNLMEQVK